MQHVSFQRKAHGTTPNASAISCGNSSKSGAIRNFPLSARSTSFDSCALASRIVWTFTSLRLADEAGHFPAKVDTPDLRFGTDGRHLPRAHDFRQLAILCNDHILGLCSDA